MRYCRYCAFCIDCDVYFCTIHDKTLNHIDRVTSCKEFEMSAMGDIITGRHYEPQKHKAREKVEPQGEQLTLDIGGVSRKNGQ